tara:strand:- start:1683 stop:1970 length:288 start_codon:yes stop_codon:yes gene_type:complete
VERIALDKSHTPKLDKEQKALMMELFDELRNDVWKEEILGVINIVAYKNGKMVPSILGWVDPDNGYCTLNKLAYTFLLEAMCLDNELVEEGGSDA